MIHRYNRFNAVCDQPVRLRYALRNTCDKLVDPPQVGCVRISTVDFQDRSFHASKHVIQTFTPERIQRICQGVYEVVVPVTVCPQAGRYFDAYTGGPEGKTLYDSFVMHEKAPPVLGYCTVQQVRCQDSQLEDEQAYSDTALNEAIAHASQLLERWTGRWFVPQRHTLFLDGSGSRMLPLPQPLLHLEGLQPLLWREGKRSERVKEWQTGEGQARDWDHPCLIVGMRLPAGQQNIVVHGLFGTTDEEGNPPAALVRATARLAARNVLNGVCNGLPLGPMVSETTDGHSYQLATAPTVQQSCFSGDPDIDAVVQAFRRPMAMGGTL